MLHPYQSKLPCLISSIKKKAKSKKSNNIRTTIFSKYGVLNPNPSEKASSLRPIFDCNKFKKNCNLIETNKQNIDRYVRKTVSKKKEENIFNETQQTSFRSDFKPKREEDIRKKHELYLNNFMIKEIDHNSENLELVLNNSPNRYYRTLIDYNILSLVKNYKFSRFELHNLYSVFQTLLRYSKSSILKFKAGFEVMLNMNRISIRSEVMERIFQEQKTLNFQNFIEMYSKIDHQIFKQNIVDYIQILFESIHNRDKIYYEDVVSIMRNRLNESDSMQISKMIFEKLDRLQEMAVTMKQITNLCRDNEEFCKRMHAVYSKQMRCE